MSSLISTGGGFINVGSGLLSTGGSTSQAATPTFSPAAGTYSAAQSVAITSTTPGNTIHYTTDGSTPTTGSPTYSGPITVSSSELLQAIATAAGYLQSAVGSAAYTISGAPTLIFSYPGGLNASNLTYGHSAAQPSGTDIDVTYSGNNQHQAGYACYQTLVNIQSFTANFTFTQTYGGTGMCFSLNNANSTTNIYPGYYANTPSADANGAGYGCYTSQVGTALGNSIGILFDGGFGFNVPSSDVTLWINGGPFVDGGQVALNGATPYGINTFNGNVISGTVVYDGTLLTCVIKDTVTGNQMRSAWPINIPACTLGNTAWVAFVAGTVNNVNQTLKTFSYYTGYNTRLASPTFSLYSGQYTGTQSLTISYPAGSTCYYTTNGLLPTSSSTQYIGAISVTANTVIQAVAIQSGYTDSLVASAVYQIGTANVINFPSGFSSSSAIMIVGKATLSGSSVLLTDNNSTIGNESGAMWFPVPINIQTFSTTFTMQFTNPYGGGANGITFCVQNYPPTSYDTTQQAGISGGPNCFGEFSNGMGYAGITSSVAVAFPNYGSSGVALVTGGATPPSASSAIAVTGLAYSNGNPITCALSYDGTTLSMTLTDTVTSGTFSHSWSVNIPSYVGASTAYVGFTAGTGGAAYNQLIENWTYHN